MKGRLIYILKYVFFLGLGIFLVWLSVKGLGEKEIAEIKTALRNADYSLAVPVFFILMGSHLIRALRWRLLIEPLSHKTKISNTFFSVMMGYLTNQAVPRMGEVIKCTMLARYEKIPAEKLIGTVILERIIDALTLLVVFALTLLVQPKLVGQIVDTMFNSKPDQPQSGGLPGYVWLLLIIGGLLLLTGLWMYFKKKTITDIRLLLKKIWKSVVEGIGTVRHLKKRWLFLFYTVSMWFLYFIGGYIGFQALEATASYGIPEAFSVLSAGSIGMIATPGGIGAYPFMVEKTMGLYGLHEDMGIAFGWLLWLAQTGVILTGGLLSFVLIPYFNKKKKKLETA